jgi:hypothetical protein
VLTRPKVNKHQPRFVNYHISHVRELERERVWNCPMVSTVFLRQLSDCARACVSANRSFNGLTLSTRYDIVSYYPSVACVHSTSLWPAHTLLLYGLITLYFSMACCTLFLYGISYTRTCTGAFASYSMGVGGPANNFVPAMSYWAQPHPHGGGANTYDIPNGVMSTESMGLSPGGGGYVFMMQTHQ